MAVGPMLAGMKEKGFSGKTSAIVSPVPGLPKIRSNSAGKALESMKLSPKAKRNAKHTY